jgi:hypothetical protein
MGTKRLPSATAEAEAEALLQELKPTLVEMIERNDPSVQSLKFNDIEAHAAAVGDLLAKLMMVRALERQPGATAAEEQAAREAAVRQAAPELRAQRPPDELQVTHIPKRARKLKTARGEITFSREYLHFPELKTGVFPPGNAAGDTGGRTDAARDQTSARTDGGH